ncbi:MAG: hypothetical protein ACREDM_02740 [Methylocella sp.]
MKATLERLVDFDLINAGSPHLSLGAVNVRTGNFVYFDNANCDIGPEHVMPSDCYAQVYNISNYGPE